MQPHSPLCNAKMDPRDFIGINYNTWENINSETRATFLLLHCSRCILRDRDDLVWGTGNYSHVQKIISKNEERLYDLNFMVFKDKSM